MHPSQALPCAPKLLLSRLAGQLFLEDGCCVCVPACTCIGLEIPVPDVSLCSRLTPPHTEEPPHNLVPQTRQVENSNCKIGQSLVATIVASGMQRWRGIFWRDTLYRLRENVLLTCRPGFLQFPVWRPEMFLRFFVGTSGKEVSLRLQCHFICMSHEILYCTRHSNIVVFFLTAN